MAKGRDAWGGRIEAGADMEFPEIDMDILQGPNENT
jgi:hypothetical protein